MTRSFVLCVSLAFIAAISCATAGGGLRNYDSPCECARMKLWQDEYLGKSPVETAGDKVMFRGWVGNDAFRVITAGLPKESLTNKVQRKEYAKRAALLTAQYKAAELLIAQNWTDTIHWADVTGMGYPSGVMSRQNIAAYAKGGSIVCINYDAGDKYIIIYEVRNKCLRYEVRWELKDRQDECR